MNQINEKVAKETEILLHDDAAIIGVYEKVLSGELRSFPPYTWELHNVGPDFWSSDKNKQDALHWLFEDKLQWNINRIKGSSTKEIREVVTENGLSGMFSNLHFRTVYEMVKFAYPKEEFKNIKTMKKQH